MNYLFVDDLKKFLAAEFDNFPQDIEIAAEHVRTEWMAI